MLVFPPAKLNVGLAIKERRQDGYHNIETLFYPLGMHDALEGVVSEAKPSLSLSGLGQSLLESSAEENLVCRAYALLAADYALPPLPPLPPLAIHLHKNIPMGAGLGGGSSDAAWMLRLLNKRFDLNLSLPTLSRYANELGSDVAFFLRDGPCFGTSRGEQLTPAPPLLKGTHVWVLLPKNTHVSTQKVYTQLVAARQQKEKNKDKRPPIPLAQALQQPKKTWQDSITNDFEEIVLASYPESAVCKECLCQAGAWYVSLSGSGAAFYGLFSRRPEAKPPPDTLSYKSIL